jgi:hypothetical protein
MKKLLALVLFAAALVAGGCVTSKSQTVSREFVQGTLATLPHSFTGSKHISLSGFMNTVGATLDFTGLRWDAEAKEWTWTSAIYNGHSPWTLTTISDTPDDTTTRAPALPKPTLP